MRGEFTLVHIDPPNPSSPSTNSPRKTQSSPSYPLLGRVMPIVSWDLGGVVLQECGLPARNAARMAALPGGRNKHGSPSPLHSRGEGKAKRPAGPALGEGICITRPWRGGPQGRDGCSLPPPERELYTKATC